MKSAQQLLDILLHSDNHAWRDDAAEMLAAEHWRESEAAEVILRAIVSGVLDQSLEQTCVESLAEIWLHNGGTDPRQYSQLPGKWQGYVAQWLKEA